MTVQEVLKSEFELLSKDLIKKYDELGMRASGDWARSNEVTTTKNSATLLANDYTDQLVFGRRPGKLPPVKNIEQWIIDKRLDFSWANNITSAAWAIAKTIQNEGTSYFKQGGTDLVSSVVTEKRIQSIIDKCGVVVVAEFTSEYVESLKQTFN